MHKINAATVLLSFLLLACESDDDNRQSINAADTAIAGATLAGQETGGSETNTAGGTSHAVGGDHAGEAVGESNGGDDLETGEPAGSDLPTGGSAGQSDPGTEEQAQGGQDNAVGGTNGLEQGNDDINTSMGGTQTVPTPDGDVPPTAGSALTDACPTVGLCSDGTWSAPESTLDDPAIITYIHATSEDGEELREYHAGHPLLISMKLQANPGFEQTLADVINMHVGLVTKLDADQPRSEGYTCYLGDVHNKGFHRQQIIQEGQSVSYKYTGLYYIPEGCIPEGVSSQAFHLWAAINPGRGADFDLPAGVENDNAGADEDYNTQFFNDRFEDMDGQDRNRLCIGADGQEGCIQTLVITPSPGHNIELDEAKLESSVFVIDPDKCEKELKAEGVEFKLQSNLKIHGSDRHDGENTDHTYDNALAGLLNTGESVSVYASLCPTDSTGACAEPGLKLKGAIPQADGSVGLQEDYGYTALYVGMDHTLNIDLHIDPRSDLCKRLTGANRGTDIEDAPDDWSQYGMFKIKVCLMTPFEEEGHGDDEEADNCLNLDSRMQVAGADEPGNGDSYEWSQTWSASQGNNVINVNAGFGSVNAINLSGASSRTYGSLQTGGWMSLPIFDLNAEGHAYVSVVGSGVEAHVDFFGSRLWGFEQTVPAVAMSYTRAYSRQRCITYNYGIAGIGLNADFCAAGEAGLELDSGIRVQENSEPRRGEVYGSVRPYANISMSASASLNVVAARGGITGTVNLIEVSVPAEAVLNWGLATTASTDQVALDIDSEITVDLVLTLLSGGINVWVDLARANWCSCGSWCPGYPCTSWARVVDQPIVNFDGFTYSYNLLTVPVFSTQIPD